VQSEVIGYLFQVVSSTGIGSYNGRKKGHAPTSRDLALPLTTLALYAKIKGHPMTGMTALLIYIVWTLILALSYATYRLPPVLTGKKAANHWERGKPVETNPQIRDTHKYFQIIQRLNR
jgi:hypothetical protein